MGGIPDGTEDAGRRVDTWRELGIERLVCGVGYDSVEDYKLQLERLARLLL